MFAFIDLYCTQPLLPAAGKVFHASEANVSLTISASTLGVALSAALLAIFAERVDRKRMIVGSMTVLALCTLLTATRDSLARAGGVEVSAGPGHSGDFHHHHRLHNRGVARIAGTPGDELLCGRHSLRRFFGPHRWVA